MNSHRIEGGRLVFDGIGRDRVELYTHHPIVEERVVIRDPHIEHAREIERAHVVAHVEEIRSRPASDPARQSLDRSEAIRKADAPARDPHLDRGGAPAPGNPANSAKPASAMNPAMAPKPANAFSPSSPAAPGGRNPAPASKDSKDSKDSRGGGGGGGRGGN